MVIFDTVTCDYPLPDPRHQHLEFQTKDQNQWTHSLTLNSLATVTINGTQYYQFALDINEQGNTSGSLLSGSVR